MLNRALRWTVAGVVVFCLTAVQLEVNVYAQTAPVKVSEAQIARAVPPESAAVSATASAAAPAPQGAPAVKKSGKKKWLLILAAAAGAAVVVILATRKDSGPSITIGPPTVGAP